MASKKNPEVVGGYTLEEVRENIATDQRWLEKSIVEIFKLQTADEQEGQHTDETNGVGFSKPDAYKLSYYAKYIITGINKYNRGYGNNLSGGYLEDAKRRMPKYAGQIFMLMKKHAAERELLKAQTLEPA